VHTNLNVITQEVTDDNNLVFDLGQPDSNQISNPFLRDQHNLSHQEIYHNDNQEEFLKEDVLSDNPNPDYQDNILTIPLPSTSMEDDLDPFVVNHSDVGSNAKVLDIPEHLLIVYAMVS
jgi:hypothetical protein